MAERRVRASDWPEQLNQIIAEWDAKPFDRENADCVEFVIEAVYVMTGERLKNPVKGEYKTLAEAARCAGNLGGIESAVSVYLGDAVPVAYASRGDVVWDGKIGLGIVAGINAFFRSENGGLDVIPVLDCAKAWRV